MLSCYAVIYGEGSFSWGLAAHRKGHGGNAFRIYSESGLEYVGKRQYKRGCCKSMISLIHSPLFLVKA